MSGEQVVLAHTPLLHAAPFVGPALLVVLLVGAIVARDRREAAREEDERA